jgi:hypothetical protein
MAVLEDPVVAVIKKLRLNAVLTALIPASHIHSSYPNQGADVPGIYIFITKAVRKPIVSSGNQTEQIYNGPVRFQIDAYSSESEEMATTLGRIAAEAVGPSIVTAGLWCFDYEHRGTNYDAIVGAFKSVTLLNSSCTEHHSSTR